MVLQRLVGLALLCSVGLVGMAIVGCVDGGNKRAVDVFDGASGGIVWLGELGSVKTLRIARRARGLGEHKASGHLRTGRMVVKSLSAAGSVVRWHNGVVSG